jgi:hypothetical protein
MSSNLTLGNWVDFYSAAQLYLHGAAQLCLQGGRMAAAMTIQSMSFTICCTTPCYNFVAVLASQLHSSTPTPTVLNRSCYCLYLVCFPGMMEWGLLLPK